MLKRRTVSPEIKLSKGDIKLGVDKFNKIEDLNKLLKWLKDNGYDFEFQSYHEGQGVYSSKGIAFKKTHKTLRLPLTYENQNGYKFDSIKAKKLSKFLKR